MRQNFPPKLRSNVLLTRYPICFLHGVKSIFNFKDYWHGIPEYLNDHGFQIFELFTHWRGPQSKRVPDLKMQILKICASTEARKVHLMAHSMGALDAMKLMDDLDVKGKIESVTFVSPPFEGTPWADFLGRFSSQLHTELRKQSAINYVKSFVKPEGVHLSTILADPKYPLNPLLKVQHKILHSYLKREGFSPKNDGIIPLESQKGAIHVCDKVILFPGDHIQVIGAGPWPKSEKTAHEVFLDQSIFLAERDLQTAK